MTQRPLILITNDDGIHSPGLHAAAEAAIELGDLLVVAPATGQTSMSRAFVAGPEVGAIAQVELDVAGRTVIGHAVTGTPAQAVTHAMLELADRRPALCISGINYGENIGGGLGVSGTIGAAMHAVSFDVPSLAVSLQVDVTDWHAADTRDWHAAIHFTRRLAVQLLAEGLPEPVAVVNLNIPEQATPETELRLTTQSRVPYYLHDHPGERALYEPVALKIRVNLDRPRIEAGSDIEAVVIDHVVSVTPLSWSMTATTDWRP